jgi:hypothetical protein
MEMKGHVTFGFMMAAGCIVFCCFDTTQYVSEINDSLQETKYLVSGRYQHPRGSIICGKCNSDLRIGHIFKF